VTRVNIELPEELHRKIKVICAMQDITIKKLVAEAMEKALEEDSR